MYELTSTLHAVASCSATVIAIVGGFFANKLVSIGIERREVLSRLSNIEDEIKFSKNLIESKKKDINEDDSFDFISENIGDFIEHESLEKIYEKQKATIDIEDLRPFWEEAKDIFKELFEELTKGNIDVNEDKIPDSGVITTFFPLHKLPDLSSLPILQNHRCHLSNFAA